MIDDIVNDVHKVAQQFHEDNAQQALENYRSARLTLLVSILLALILGVIVTFWLVTSIIKPLQTAVAVAQKVAAGDLRSHLARARAS